jgi:hypothetical protein
MSDACSWFPVSPADVRSWVERHSHELPTTLSELAKYPIPFRKAIVAAVSPEVRASLWKEHLLGIATADTQLSPPQRSFVRAAANDIAPLIGQPAPNPTIVAWETRMRGLFSSKQAARIFGTLGPEEPAGGLPLPADVRPESAT